MFKPISFKTFDLEHKSSIPGYISGNRNTVYFIGNGFNLDEKNINTYSFSFGEVTTPSETEKIIEALLEDFKKRLETDIFLTEVWMFNNRKSNSWVSNSSYTNESLIEKVENIITEYNTKRVGYNVKEIHERMAGTFKDQSLKITDSPTH